MRWKFASLLGKCSVRWTGASRVLDDVRLSVLLLCQVWPQPHDLRWQPFHSFRQQDGARTEEGEAKSCLLKKVRGNLCLHYTGESSVV